MGENKQTSKEPDKAQDKENPTVTVLKHLTESTKDKGKGDKK